MGACSSLIHCPLSQPDGNDNQQYPEDPYRGILFLSVIFELFLLKGTIQDSPYLLVHGKTSHPIY
jgi:hypothetical protein